MIIPGNLRIIFAKGIISQFRIVKRNCSHFLKLRMVSKNYSARFYCTSKLEVAVAENRCCESEDQMYRNMLQNFEKSVLLDNLEGSELESVLKRFQLQGLGTQHLHKYNVKISCDMNSLLFPFDSINKEVAAIQYLTHKKDVVGERLETSFFPKSSVSTLFGWSISGSERKEIVVTSSPLDAVAINQETDVPAIAVPDNFTTFGSELLDILKQFKKVIFWLKPDQHEWKIHRVIACSLGNSAFFIRPNENCFGALLNLQNECDIENILLDAYPLSNENVETFYSYKSVIYNEFKEHDRNSGLKWKRFSVLNDLLKGHRMGELTVFSGQTGTGKTTFMSEYSLDLCMQGLPTLWGSFEISNTRLMKTMLTQFSLCSFVENLDSFEYWSEEFLKIPMFFLNFHGQRSLKRIIHAMAHCVTVYGIRHVVIDNLQFMMNMDDFGNTMDYLRRQDQIYSAFREFASYHQCHVTLVMHPRKEPEFTELNNTSISGTAKATQEADNILILQTTKSRQYLQVTKNRFDGHKGCVILEFDKKTQTFTIKKIAAFKPQSSSS